LCDEIRIHSYLAEITLVQFNHCYGNVQTAPARCGISRHLRKLRLLVVEVTVLDLRHKH